MSSAFFGLDIALRALHSQQVALDVTSHKVANANTAGYSRQRVNLQTTEPYTLPGLNRAAGPGQIGTGVNAIGIDRSRDLFADVQYRTEVGTQHQAQVQSDALEQIETVLNEPAATGLASLLTRFFGAWQDVVNDPSDPATRATVIEQSAALANGFGRAARQLGAIQQSLNDYVALDVAQINDLGRQVAALNRQIVQVEVLGQRANDFRDRRDLLVDQLSQLAQVALADNADGSIDVALGGHSLVQGGSVDALTTTAGPGGLWEVRFTSDNALASFSGGEVRGLLDARDTNVPSYLSQLNTLATSLINGVNALHTTGYGQDGISGRPFFAGTDAATMAVDAAIVADPRKLGAASAANQAGNSATALAIAQLRQNLNPPPEGAYNALISSLGVDSHAARGIVENQELLVQLLDRRRQTVAGVSLDEEATLLLRYQRSYEAAARLITTIDQMLDRLINNTGIVGR